MDGFVREEQRLRITYQMYDGDYRKHQAFVDLHGDNVGWFKEELRLRRLLEAARANYYAFLDARRSALDTTSR